MAQLESATRSASEIYKRQTDRPLRVTEQDVVNEEMYEEKDDDLKPELLLQQETIPDSYDEHVAECKAIYAYLEMYVAKYRDVDKKPASALVDEKLQSNEQAIKYEKVPDNISPHAISRQILGAGRRMLRKVSKVRRGLASWVNGARLSVIADTGAAANVISAAYVKQRKLVVDRSSSAFKLGNSSVIDSLGTVTIDYAFGEDPLNVFKLVCHVLPNCVYDLILGNVFLTATKTMSKHRRRLTECVFSVVNVFHLGYLGNFQQVLEGTLDDRYPSFAIPDTGAERNVIDLQYVFALIRASFSVAWFPLCLSLLIVLSVIGMQ